MDLVHLRAFATVARLSNFTRAAERLNLSQPAVSGQIRALEQELGADLFIRDGKKIRLSDAGAQLLGSAEEVLAAMSGFLEKGRALVAAPPSRVRLGIIVGADLMRTGGILTRIHQEAPSIRVDVQQGLSGWVTTSVRAGTLDAGFFLGPNLPSDADAVELARITYLVTLPAAWRDRVAGADWTDIARLPWIWTPENGSYPHIVRDMFGQRNLSLTHITEADREETIVTLVASGVGACILREEVARKVADDHRVIIWEKGRREVPLYLVTKRRDRPDPAVEILRRAVLAEWGLA
jgi:DNA-binding transcriptional LysR family regulator